MMFLVPHSEYFVSFFFKKKEKKEKTNETKTVKC